MSHGNEVYNFPISYPSAGYGGGSLLPSDSKKYLLFSFYSGQSQEAFMLFKIGDAVLELLYESSFMFGECADYRFTSDETALIQILRTGWWYEGDSEIDKDGTPFYKFGEINIIDFINKTIDRHIIHSYTSEKWKQNVTDSGLFGLPHSISKCILDLTMPWVWNHLFSHWIALLFSNQSKRKK